MSNRFRFLIRPFVALSLLTTIHAGAGRAQEPVHVPFDSVRWNVQYADFTPEIYQGKESILIRQGAILLKGVSFLNGVIDLEISFPSVRAFPGVAFRLGEDLNTFENVYVRPHASGNPDAVQYTPVFNGDAGWQLYHGEGFTAAATFRHDSWHHLRIVVKGMAADVFLDDMETPLINISRLKGEPTGGPIALMASLAPVRFADFRYTLSDERLEEVAPESSEPNVITEWHVSDIVSDSIFMMPIIDPSTKASLKWTRRRSESSGLINLSRFAKRREGHNTIVARLEVVSESEQIKPIQFGFSDHVLVLVNDRAVYRGSDPFQSRDFRFLGTIGYYDTLFLPLKKGLNAVWFIVSENLGGWGVQARFMDMEGIRLE